MDFGFSEEQEMLRKSARDFLARECPMAHVRQMMEPPPSTDAVQAPLNGFAASPGAEERNVL